MSEPSNVDEVAWREVLAAGLAELEPTLEKIDLEDLVAVRVTVRPGMAVRLMRARRAAQHDPEAAAVVLGVMDQLLHKMAVVLNERMHAEKADGQSNG